MKPIVVREYARLTTDSVVSTLDQATVSTSAFEWLCNLAASFNRSGASLLHLENRRWLRLDNYVGILETPCGTLLEVLPKHTDEANDQAIEASRQLLTKMLAVALDLPVRTTDKTDIQTFRHPLLEWIMKQFVLSLDLLIKRGLRFDYRRIEEEQRYLRGQLDINKQMRQPPGRAHIFNIRHDLFLVDGPENRLIKSALMLVCKATQQPDTWRLSHELAGLLADLPSSKDVPAEFLKWRNDRLMAHYQPVRPWCELVLGQHMPLALRGKTHGISLLFPMEKLFERYVEVNLRKQFPIPYSLKPQAASQSLCTHQEKSMFQLKPDFLILRGHQTCLVLDTKWKRISSSKDENKYGLSQSDFYQMFAYGHKYLAGKGEMLLIYPLTKGFSEVLPPFDYSSDLRLWVAPFDLENDEMIWPIAWQKTFFNELRHTG
ncbi:MAG: McrC family protein [Methylomonas sp.]|jgi:5-methylcytosine-specific restriction enzyme subunit McrC|uniref:McrC family protein n=1 Tax=Methylomonas sp. TaxID=418 RepID=UPI0025E983A6|nr:McrC family protein [Methylomonas sp.]MCK9608046.1 McrC family protein [Methylomonas sp.]